MGKRGEKTRPIKITMPTKKSAQTMAKSKKKIREKFTKVSVQQCMTHEERRKRRELVEHCKKERKKTGFDLVIFAQHILKRTEIAKLKADISKSDFVSPYDPDYVPPETIPSHFVQESNHIFDHTCQNLNKPRDRSDSFYY